MNNIIPLKNEYSLDFVKNIIFQLGVYKEFNSIASNFKKVLDFFIPGIAIDYVNKELTIDGITITNEV